MTGEFPGEAGTLYLTGLMYLIRIKLKVAAGWEVSPQTNGPGGSTFTLLPLGNLIWRVTPAAPLSLVPELRIELFSDLFFYV